MRLSLCLQREEVAGRAHLLLPAHPAVVAVVAGAAVAVAGAVVA